MKYLKLFEAYSDKINISSLSNFNAEDVDDFYEMFQDFAVEFNIQESDTENLDVEVEENRYYIDTFRNAFIEMILFRNIEEIIETLKSNFLGRLESVGWILAAGENSFDVIYNKNDSGNEFAIVSICIRKNYLD